MRMLPALNTVLRREHDRKLAEHHPAERPVPTVVPLTLAQDDPGIVGGPTPTRPRRAAFRVQGAAECESLREMSRDVGAARIAARDFECHRANARSVARPERFELPTLRFEA